MSDDPKLYRVSYEKTDGTTDVHEHLRDTQLIALGLSQEWSMITRVVIELENTDT